MTLRLRPSSARPIVRSIVCALLASLAGCNFSDCVYELRGVTTNGIVSDNGAQLASATISEHEQRDTDPDKDITWTITSQALAGHIQSMVLVDNSARSVVLYTFSISPAAAQPIVSSGYARQSEGANLNGFFDLLANNRGLIVISTDLPGKATIEIPLSVSNRTDWYRPNCS